MWLLPSNCRISFSQRIMNVRPLPGRLTADATLQILIQYAYGVEPYQVVGVPDPLTSRRYQIDAKADGAARPRSNVSHAAVAA